MAKRRKRERRSENMLRRLRLGMGLVCRRSYGELDRIGMISNRRLDERCFIERRVYDLIEMWVEDPARQTRNFKEPTKPEQTMMAYTILCDFEHEYLEISRSTMKYKHCYNAPRSLGHMLCIIKEVCGRCDCTTSYRSRNS